MSYGNARMFWNCHARNKTKLIARLVLRQKGKIYWPIFQLAELVFFRAKECWEHHNMLLQRWRRERSSSSLVRLVRERWAFYKLYRIYLNNTTKLDRMTIFKFFKHWTSGQHSANYGCKTCFILLRVSSDCRGLRRGVLQMRVTGLYLYIV